MSEKNRQKISAFALAAEDAAVTAEVSVEDVMEARPGWTRQQAERWLRANAEAIGRVMVLSGMGEMLRRVGGADHA